MEEKKIGMITGASMLGFAVAIDGFQALFSITTPVPLIGWVIGPVGGGFVSFVGVITLSCWCYYLGVPFASRVGTAALIEFIPVINVVPAYTAAVGLTILAANNQTLGGALSVLGMGLASGSASVTVAAKEKEAIKHQRHLAEARRGGTETKQPSDSKSGERNTPPLQSTVGTQSTQTPARFSDIREPGAPIPSAAEKTPAHAQQAGAQALGSSIPSESALSVHTPPSGEPAQAARAQPTPEPLPQEDKKLPLDTPLPDTLYGTPIKDLGGDRPIHNVDAPAQDTSHMGKSLESGLPIVAAEAQERPLGQQYYWRDDAGWAVGKELAGGGGDADEALLENIKRRGREGGRCAMVHTHPQTHMPGNAIPSVPDAVFADARNKGCDNLVVDGNGTVWKTETDPRFSKYRAEYEKRFDELRKALQGTDNPNDLSFTINKEKVATWVAEMEKLPVIKREQYLRSRLLLAPEQGGLEGGRGETARQAVRRFTDDPLTKLHDDYLERREGRGGTFSDADVQEFADRYKRHGITISKLPLNS